MAQKLFLTSVADVYAYDENDNLLFQSKTLLNSSMEVTLGNTEVRGGRGNQLLLNYFHTNAMTISLEETQFNLSMLGATTGKSVVTGNSVYTEENVTLGAGGTGTVTGTPLAIQGATIYGWVKLESGSTERVTFTGSNFTAVGGASGDIVCVRYYANNAASRSITIPANTIPKVVRLVMEAQLNSSDVATQKIGTLQVIVPKFQLNGAFTLNLASDGVSNLPLSGMALAYSDSASAQCTNNPVYAHIIEILDNTNWYDNVIGLSIEGGNFALATTLGTKTLVVYAIPNNGDAPFIVNNAQLTFTSATAGVATIGLNTGLVTGVSAGTSLLTATITSKNTVETQCTVTVPA